MNIFKKLWVWLYSITIGRRLRKEYEERMRQQLRDLRCRQEEGIRLSQAQCPHLQGSNRLSFSSSHLTCIVWHYYNDHIWRGICTNCGRKFTPADKDFFFWFNAKCGNHPSTAIDPPEWSWPNARRDTVGSSPSYTSTQKQVSDLDALSDDEINDLMAKVKLAWPLNRDPSEPADIEPGYWPEEKLNGN